MKKLSRSMTIPVLIFSGTLAFANAAVLNQKEYLFYNLTAFLFFSVPGLMAEIIIAIIFFIKNKIEVNNIKYVIAVNIITYPLYYFGDYMVKDYFMIILHDKLTYVVYYVSGAILIIFFESYFLYLSCKKQLEFNSFLFLSIIMNSVSLLIGGVASVFGKLFLEMR